MKKFLIAFLMMGLLSPVCNAEVRLHFNVSQNAPGDDNIPIGNPLPRDLTDSISVAIDAYTLYLYDGCDDTTLRLISSDETIVFSTSIDAGTTSVVLPGTLSGEYRLEIVKGNITFYCYIEL